VNAGLTRCYSLPGPERLLRVLAERDLDPRSLRAAAALVHELDVEARDRDYVNDHEERSHAA
jgi:hypothetical protein